MSTSKLYKTEAIVLKSSDLGEADRLLTLYTPHLGKLRVVARGARKPKSKLGGHVETLTHSLLMIARGHTLDIVSQSQTLHSFQSVREGLGLLSLSLYAADLVNSFSEERLENLAVFKLLLDTLIWLSSTSDIPDQQTTQKKYPDLPREQDTIIHHFELHLLEYLGYQPQLLNCVHCHCNLEPVTNFFSPNNGGVICPHCREHESWVRPISVNALKCLRLFQFSPRENICRIRINTELSVELKQHIRGYIRHLLERDVKSATWLDRIQQSANINNTK